MKHLNQFNIFDDNTKFIIKTFENCSSHFIDIEICLKRLFLKLAKMYIVFTSFYENAKDLGLVSQILEQIFFFGKLFQ